MSFSKNKIAILLLMVFILQIIPLQSFAIDGLSPYPTYDGLYKGGDLYQTLRFNDIGTNTDARAAIQEIAALTLMRGASNTSFQPNRNITYLEALITLVKVIGQEKEAQRQGEAQAPQSVRDMIILSTVDNWGRGYLQVARQSNIVTPQEVNKITDLTPQQIESLEENLRQRMQIYEDRDLTQAEMNNIENQIRGQLETRAAWNRPVSRQQLVTWVARALGLEGIYGTDIKILHKFNDMGQIDTDKAPLIEAVLQRDAEEYTKKKSLADVILRTSSATSFAPRQNVPRAQMAQILEIIHDDLLEERGLTKKEGEIVALEDVEHQGIKKKVITLNNDDNSKNLIITEKNKNDFPVRKQGSLAMSEILRNGDWIRYYINENNEVIYASADTQDRKIIEGFIEALDIEGKQLIVTDFQDQKHILQLQPSAIIQINGKDIPLGDLLYGMEIKAIVINKRITNLQGYLEEDPDRHGYIPPGTRTKIGDILFIDANTVEIRTKGLREKYKITPATRVLRNERPANLFEIKTGDRVILFFDDIYNPDIATIRVEDHERHIDGIFRGQIEQVDQRNREIVLNNISVYQQGRWVRYGKDQVKLRAEGDLLFEGPSKITLRDLTTRKGLETYAAIENSYGVAKIAKLLVKQGSSVLYESTISDIEYNTSRMVADNVGFTFHPGTIVVKNNRLVDSLNLDEKQTVSIAADLYRGLRNASFIAIEDTGILDERIDFTQLVIYRGTVEDIHEYGVNLGRLGYRLDYLKLEDNQWKEISGKRKLTLTEDTLIFDSDLKKEIDPSYFIDTRFIDAEDIEDKELRDRIKQRFYFDKAGYFIVKETHVDGETYEEVLALSLTPTSIHEGGKLHIEHSAIGEVLEVNMDNETISLTNLKHWNTLNKRWETVRSNETISTDRAVIIINDKSITKDELYKIRKKAKIYAVKSKNTSTQDDAYVIVVEQ